VYDDKGRTQSCFTEIWALHSAYNTRVIKFNLFQYCPRKSGIVHSDRSLCTMPDFLLCQDILKNQIINIINHSCRLINNYYYISIQQTSTYINILFQYI